MGSGGRENALSWGLSQSEEVEKVFIAPGNGGSGLIKNVEIADINEKDFESLKNFCISEEIGLVVIGPEGPLADGLADVLRAANIPVFGPNKDGAQLEASKDWAKKLMNISGIPTAKHWTVSSEDEAINVLNKVNQPLVVKANGLAGGKGVTVPKNIHETASAIHDAFDGKFGSAGETLILEEILSGPEVSIFALCDGEEMIILPPAQDHKRLKEGDAGPNTGGMGAYAPAPLVNDAQLNEIKKSILIPTIEALKKQGIDYRGVIYAGLMLTKNGPKVIEYNCRFGDPECQVLIPLLGRNLALVLQACAHGNIKNGMKLEISKLASVCVVLAADGYPESPRKGDLIRIDLEPSSNTQIFHSGTKMSSDGGLSTIGGRVISIVSQGNSFDEAFSSAYESIKKIDFKGMNFRKDIGHQVRGDSSQVTSSN